MTNLDSRDKNTRTLFEAIQHGRYRQVVLLFEAGVDVNCRNEKGYTPLISSCENIEDGKYRIRFTRLLLDLGADPNVQDWKGLTALMHASIRGYEDVVAVLLDNQKTDVAVQDDEGNTALMHAAIQGHGDIIFSLLQHYRQNKHPSGIHERNKKGHNAVQLAASNNHDSCVFLLTREARQFPVTPSDMFPSPKVLERVPTPCKKWYRRRAVSQDSNRDKQESKDRNVASLTSLRTNHHTPVDDTEFPKWEGSSRSVLYLPPLSTDVPTCRLFGTLASASLFHQRQNSGTGRL